MMSLAAVPGNRTSRPKGWETHTATPQAQWRPMLASRCQTAEPTACLPVQGWFSLLSWGDAQGGGLVDADAQILFSARRCHPRLTLESERIDGSNPAEAGTQSDGRQRPRIDLFVDLLAAHGPVIGGASER